ncbi:MAG: GNAT family N-acetyltransferase [Anaerolineales bacterium]|nr:GNAT family N-acetyltransferase [Anaerolineales bacterium]
MDLKIKLLPASDFTLAELTAIYNQTRVDYLVPMPMNAARLADYISTYDVSLKRSLVAMQGDQLRGVAMLGARPDRAWVTRLGVIPTTRRTGVGEALTVGLLEQAEKLKINFDMLEVIKNNTPAHTLFRKLGFYEVGELLVLRRSPILPPDPVVAEAERLDRAEALILVGRNRGTQPWTNQSESLFNAQEVSGLHVTLVDGSRGWLVYQRQKFTLTRFIYKTEVGDPVKVAYAFLSHLHQQYPRLDTQIENIQLNDPHLPAFYKMGYVESFRRIEMWRGAPPESLQAG